MRFTGDGKAGFEALLMPGERLALLRQALAPGHAWSVRLGSTSYDGLRCGLLDGSGTPLLAEPCAALLRLDDRAGTEARLGFYVELAASTSRASAEIRWVALASDAARDTDGDGVPEVLDNCPGDWNAAQGDCSEEPPPIGPSGGAGATGEGGAGGEAGAATDTGGTAGSSAGRDSSEGGAAGEPETVTGGAGPLVSNGGATAGATSAAGASSTSGGANGSSGASGSSGMSGTLGGAAGTGSGGSSGSPQIAAGTSGDENPEPNPGHHSGCGCRLTDTEKPNNFAILALGTAAYALRKRRQLRPGSLSSRFHRRAKDQALSPDWNCKNS
jgi:hypothetical protein